MISKRDLTFDFVDKFSVNIFCKRSFLFEFRIWLTEIWCQFRHILIGKQRKTKSVKNYGNQHELRLELRLDAINCSIDVDSDKKTLSSPSFSMFIDFVEKRFQNCNFRWFYYHFLCRYATFIDLYRLICGFRG